MFVIRSDKKLHMKFKKKLQWENSININGEM
jgi:hypothetical protein